jgi:hypothetical protein
MAKEPSSTDQAAEDIGGYGAFLRVETMRLMRCYKYDPSWIRSCREASDKFIGGFSILLHDSGLLRDYRVWKWGIVRRILSMRDKK